VGGKGGDCRGSGDWNLGGGGNSQELRILTDVTRGEALVKWDLSPDSSLRFYVLVGGKSALVKRQDHWFVSVPNLCWRPGGQEGVRGMHFLLRGRGQNVRDEDLGMGFHRVPGRFGPPERRWWESGSVGHT